MNWKALFLAVLFVLGAATGTIAVISLFVWSVVKLSGLIVVCGFAGIVFVLLVTMRYQETKDRL
jgi:hypothetical protein